MQLIQHSATLWTVHCEVSGEVCLAAVCECRVFTELMYYVQLWTEMSSALVFSYRLLRMTTAMPSTVSTN